MSLTVSPSASRAAMAAAVQDFRCRPAPRRRRRRRFRIIPPQSRKMLRRHGQHAKLMSLILSDFIIVIH